MAVVTKAWGRLSIPGKVIFTAIPLLLALGIGLAVAIAVLGGPIVALATEYWEVVRFLVAATIILLITVPTAFLIIFMEMKVIAFMNLRVGPDRVGPWGRSSRWCTG